MAQVPATSIESTSLGDVAEFTIPFPFLSPLPLPLLAFDAALAGVSAGTGGGLTPNIVHHIE